MSKAKLLVCLDAMNRGRKAMSNGNYPLCCDGAIALEMITLITNAYRNEVISWREMTDLLSEHIIQC